MARCRTCGKTALNGYEYCIQCNPKPGSASGRAPEGRADGRFRQNRGARPGERDNISSRSHAELAPDYLKNGYFNENGRLREEIFTLDAENVAAVLSANEMTSAAIRRFFNKLRGIDARFKSSRDFESTKEDLYGFYPQAAYAVGRKVAPEQFRKFIEKNIKLAVIDEKHYKGFVEHFQSVVAYFKEKDQRRR